ncbi:MAG: hypothetical protein AAB426_00445 [Myxococcota bacterium]|mgnify:CR=1 FL=1
MTYTSRPIGEKQIDVVPKPSVDVAHDLRRLNSDGAVALPAASTGGRLDYTTDAHTFRGDTSKAVAPKAAAGLAEPAPGVGAHQPKPVENETVLGVRERMSVSERESDAPKARMTLQDAMGLRDLDQPWAVEKPGAVVRIPKGATWEDVANRYYAAHLHTFEEPQRSEVRGQIITVLQVATAFTKVAAEMARDPAPPSAEKNAQAAKLLRSYTAKLASDPAGLGALILPDVPYVDESVRALTCTPAQFRSYLKKGTLNASFPHLVAMHGGAEAFVHGRVGLLRAVSDTQPHDGRPQLSPTMQARNALLGTSSQVAGLVEKHRHGRLSQTDLRSALAAYGLRFEKLDTKTLTLVLAGSSERVTLGLVRRDGKIVGITPPKGDVSDDAAAFVEWFGGAITAAGKDGRGLDSAALIAILTASDAPGAETRGSDSRGDADVARPLAPDLFGLATDHTTDGERGSVAGKSRQAQQAQQDEMLDRAKEFADHVAEKNRAVTTAEINNDLVRGNPRDPLPRKAVVSPKKS